MTIRPGKKYAGIVKKLQLAASDSGRSLNNFVLFLLDNHLKNSNNEQQNAGQTAERTSSCKGS